MADIIYTLQDLRYLEWSRIRHSSGTAGSFLKAYSDLEGKKTYYKLSSYNSAEGIIGHECVNEIIADRLLTILGIYHLQYTLLHAVIHLDGRDVETWLCASEDFKRRGESKLSLEAYYEQEKLEEETPLAFCERCGWGETVGQMLLTDYLIENRDRHGANIEVLRDPAARTVRLAPLFDHGLSLLFSARTAEEAAEYDIHTDRRIQCFVGGSLARENLRLLSHAPKVHPLCEEHKAVLLAGLEEILPSVWTDKIWELIWGRWKEYVHLRDS